MDTLESLDGLLGVGVRGRVLDLYCFAGDMGTWRGVVQFSFFGDDEMSLGLGL